jgi:hypothetical protein
VLFTYTPLIGGGYDRRGQSVGTYRGVRFVTETEAHFPQEEACRVYYSDDNGRRWTPNDGWIIGWRDRRYSDALTEPTGIELSNGNLLLLARTERGCVYRAESDDRGATWWPGARPTALCSSYSPGVVFRLPRTGDLGFVWNQLSRPEILRGLRRSRLSSAVSLDEGRTWTHFKNLAAIASLADRSYLPPEDSFEPVWGADDVGKLPDDFRAFNYARVSVVGDLVFVGYEELAPVVETDPVEGTRHVADKVHKFTRVFSPNWFYRNSVQPALKTNSKPGE